MITDRLRFTVMQVNTNTVLARDLVVQEPKVIWYLSGPAHVEFKIPASEQFNSSFGIEWKNWGQWVIVELEIDHVRKIVCAVIVTNNVVDASTGFMSIEGTGFMNYPKGIPWLVNFNPIAVDPFEVVQRIWAYCQGFSNAQLGVEVIPATSGTQMLPGYGFDGNILSFDFFAMFIRAVDFADCGDLISGLARDIPFDMFEEAVWDVDRTEVTKNLRLAHPLGGFHQDFLTFRHGVNVITAEKAEEMEIEPVSDVIIRGWLPGKVYSSQVSNVDMTRLRRVIMEEDAKIDSTERAAAWAKRKLQRRNVPKHFKKIIVDPNHPDAPYGKFDVGDSIYVEAPYPWYGDIKEWHRITSIAYDDTGLMELELKVEGAFNYDPIEYNPDVGSEPTKDLNRLSNGYFQTNLSGWTAVRGQWFRVSTITFDASQNPNAGSVRVDCDDAGEKFLSHKVHVTPGEHLAIEAAVRWEDVASGSGDSFQLLGITSLNGDLSNGHVYVIDEYVHPVGTHGWQLLHDFDWVVPNDIPPVNELAIQLTVTSGVTAGITWWTYARILPAGAE